MIRRILLQCIQLLFLTTCPMLAIEAADTIKLFNPEFPVNAFSIGMDKNVNIHNFFSDFSLTTSLLECDIMINNRFRSTSINTNELNFKDDNNFKLEISKDVFKNWKVGIDNYFLYNLDSRPIGNNRLFEVSSIPNIKFLFLDKSFIQIGIGKEYNEKVEIKSNGTALLINGQISNFNIEDVFVNSFLYLKSTKYQDSRINRTLNSSTNITTNYSQMDKIGLGINYTDNLRDFINFIDLTQKQYLFEQNADRSISTNLSLDYNPFPEFLLNSRIDYSFQSKSREFNKSSDLLLSSAFKRESQVIKFQINNSAIFTFDNILTGINIDYESVEETFNATPQNANLLPSIASTFQNTQKMNDYNSNRVRISSNSSVTFTKRDSLLLSLSASLYQYDTPNKENNDEHDESFSGLFAKYFRRCNKYFSLALSTELKNQHFVYLKAEKSGQSYELKSIRFKPEMIYSSAAFFWNPQFEILANYHIYDFQAQMNSVSTFSFRQLSYQDSIAIHLNGKIFISSNILLRYSERSILYWDNFSENPIKGNLEQMYKLMIYNKIANLTFGIGTGMYKFTQSDLQGTSNNYSSIIISPEAVIGIIFSLKGKLNINCKYDFQDIGGVHREVPNISLKTEIAF